MSDLSILTLPSPLLRQKCEPVPAVTEDLLVFLDAMVEVMKKARGVGLAAPQIGVLKRVVVMDVYQEEDSSKRGQIDYLINPEIIWASEEKSQYEEGCLSIPDFSSVIERPAVVRVRFLDREGMLREETFEKLAATCVQHEIDHLNGILFIDYLPRILKNRIVKKFIKKSKERAL